jgi:hypothetical protein
VHPPQPGGLAGTRSRGTDLVGTDRSRFVVERHRPGAGAITPAVLMVAFNLVAEDLDLRVPADGSRVYRSLRYPAAAEAYAPIRRQDRGTLVDRYV